MPEFRNLKRLASHLRSKAVVSKYAAALIANEEIIIGIDKFTYRRNDYEIPNWFISELRFICGTGCFPSGAPYRFLHLTQHCFSGILPFYFDMTGKEFRYCFSQTVQKSVHLNFKRQHFMPGPLDYADTIDAYIEYKLNLLKHKAEYVFRRKVLFEKIK
jgi:hypothetical protein